MAKLIPGARSARASTAAFAAALVGLALALLTPLPARAQYMSCAAFLELDQTLQHIYITGFVEGVTYTQLELSQLVSTQAAEKKLEDGEKLVLGVMQRVADNIAQAIPSGLTVEEVTDRLKELCATKEKNQAAFVNIYSEYSIGLRQAARTRTELQRGSGDAAPAGKAAAPAPAAGAAAAKPAAPPKAAAPAGGAAKPATPAPAAGAPAAAKPAAAPAPAQKQP